MKKDGKDAFPVEICRVKRDRCEVSNLERVLKEHFSKQPAWILFWELHRVDFAWYDGENIHWYNNEPEKYLIETRIFNEEKECHIRKIEDKFIGRVIHNVHAEQVMNVQDIDDKSAIVYKKIITPYMWGSIVENGVIREDRGMQYHLPCNPKATRFGYEVEQYYIPDPVDGMLKLLDYRMTKIFEEAKNDSNPSKKEFVRTYLEIGGVDANG